MKGPTAAIIAACDAAMPNRGAWNQNPDNPECWYMWTGERRGTDWWPIWPYWFVNRSPEKQRRSDNDDVYFDNWDEVAVRLDQMMENT